MLRPPLAALCLALIVLPAPALPGDPVPRPQTVAEVPRMEAAEALGLVAKDQAVVIDVRSPTAFQLMHAEGALSLPEAEVGARIQELPKDKLVIAYCT